MDQIHRRIQEGMGAMGLSLTDREEDYLQSTSFPSGVLREAREKASSKDDDVIEITAKDYKLTSSSHRVDVKNQIIDHFHHFSVAVGALEKVIKGRHENLKEKGITHTIYSLESPISTRHFLPSNLPNTKDERVSQLYITLLALKNSWNNSHLDWKLKLINELERRFFNYFYEWQFESPKPEVKVQRLDYYSRPSPRKFNFEVKYVYL